MVDRNRLRKLAEIVKANAGELYGLDWETTEKADAYSVSPRIFIGGHPAETFIRIGCWSPEQARKIQPLAEYLSMLTPDTVLELLEEDDGKDSRGLRDVAGPAGLEHGGMYQRPKRG